MNKKKLSSKSTGIKRLGTRLVVCRSSAKIISDAHIKSTASLRKNKEE